MQHEIPKYSNATSITNKIKIDLNNQQNATTFSFINLFNSAHHVSGDKFAHPQEYFLTAYTAFGTIHRHCCRPVPRLRWNSILSQQLHPVSCTMGTGSFPGVKSGRGVTLTSHPFLVSWSWKGRAIPLLPLWVVRPVQSLSACKGVTFTFF